MPQSVLRLGSEWPWARTHLGEACAESRTPPRPQRWPLAPPSPLGPRPTPPAGPPQLADGGPCKKNTILLALTLSFNHQAGEPILSFTEIPTGPRYWQRRS